MTALPPELTKAHRPSSEAWEIRRTGAGMYREGEAPVSAFASVFRGVLTFAKRRASRRKADL